VRDWLGIDKDFDAHKKGTSIGSWDNFSDEDDDDSSGWKGGSAGAESVDDPDFAASIDANAVHGSDALETAKVEMGFFFAGMNVYSR